MIYPPCPPPRPLPFSRRTHKTTPYLASALSLLGVRVTRRYIARLDETNTDDLDDALLVLDGTECYDRKRLVLR